LLDLVDHETQRITAALLIRRGRLVTLLSVPDRAAFADRRVTAWRVSLALASTIRPVISDVLSLEHAEIAHQRLRDGGVQGKLLLRVANSE
jgi:NADPH:quinone reductase-like Zn-dependent oxidoreductase